VLPPKESLVVVFDELNKMDTKEAIDLAGRWDNVLTRLEQGDTSEDFKVEARAVIKQAIVLTAQRSN
jgi:hypothetical protein